MTICSVADLCRKFSGNEWPTFLSVNPSANNKGANNNNDTCEVVLRVESDIRWFAGHFPGQPVLPGVVQSHWACSISQFIFAADAHFSRLDNLKFQTMIFPEVELSLILTSNPEKHSVKFCYCANGTIFSEGNIVFSKQ